MKNQFLFKLSGIITALILNSCIISNYDQPSSVLGKITDSSGKAISNATIISEFDNSNDSVKTSSNGSYQMAFKTGGPVNLTFAKSGYTSKKLDLILLGGEKKVLDMSLNSLSEDGYFSVGLKELTILNMGETYKVDVSTNLSYTCESDVQWISLVKNTSSFYIKCEANETSEERTATIILKAEYNHVDTIKIKQLAGPVLRVVDYLGKNNTSFPHTKPFVTFSKEIVVITATSSNESLSYELSDDKKTVYFKNIKLNAFSVIPIQLTVKAFDGIYLNFSLDFKLFVNYQPIVQGNNESIFFTEDNQFVWIYTSDMRREHIVLKQYSTKDFSEKKQILNENFYAMSYNPYNNCLYLMKQVYFEDRYITEISLYDASTGVFKNKITIDYYGNLVDDIDFSDNGYGIMLVGQNLFYIDSSKNHNFGVFSTSSMLYDQFNPDNMIPSEIDISDKNKVFLLYGQNSTSVFTAYTINADTKVLKKIYSSNNMSFVASKSSPYVFYFSKYINKIICQNVNNASTSTLNLASSGVSNLVILASENPLPYVFTSDVSLISASDNTMHNFSHQSECYYIKSSNDGKLLLVNNNNIVYLFQSEIFTKFYDYIK